jgi:hypothetical protein
VLTDLPAIESLEVELEATPSTKGELMREELLAAERGP